MCGVRPRGCFRCGRAEAPSAGQSKGVSLCIHPPAFGMAALVEGPQPPRRFNLEAAGTRACRAWLRA